MLTAESLRERLREVKDPEIPVISVIDLGIVQNIRVEDGVVSLDLVPTFAGCPAIEVMRAGIEKSCREAGATEVKVQVVQRAWSSNRISDTGRKKLLDFGISPPPVYEGEVELSDLELAECPVCHSRDTVLKNSFGPTACRAIHYCNNCKETFEQMKPL